VHGTWQTTGGGGSGVPVTQIIAAGVLVGVAAGIAEAVAQFVDDVALLILITVFVLLVLLVAGAAWALVYRVRHGEPPWAPLGRRVVPSPVVHQLGEPERPALPQHVHFHFDGADPAAVAEVIRRQQAE
jgi:hypothetical protein